MCNPPINMPEVCFLTLVSSVYCMLYFPLTFYSWLTNSNSEVGSINCTPWLRQYDCGFACLPHIFYFLLWHDFFKMLCGSVFIFHLLLSVRGCFARITSHYDIFAWLGKVWGSDDDDACSTKMEWQKNKTKNPLNN